MASLVALPGAGGVDFDAQERAAWLVVAGACEEALDGLHQLHPERPAFLRVRAACLRAAGLPAAGPGEAS